MSQISWERMDTDAERHDTVISRPSLATGAVVSVDLNPGMLRVARSTVSKDSHPGATIEWREASADKLPFPDATFDIVYCQLGLQFFVDRDASAGFASISVATDRQSVSRIPHLRGKRPGPGPIGAGPQRGGVCPGLPDHLPRG